MTWQLVLRRQVLPLTSSKDDAPMSNRVSALELSTIGACPAAGSNKFLSRCSVRGVARAEKEAGRAHVDAAMRRMRPYGVALIAAYI